MGKSREEGSAGTNTGSRCKVEGGSGGNQDVGMASTEIVVSAEVGRSTGVVVVLVEMGMK